MVRYPYRGFGSGDVKRGPEEKKNLLPKGRRSEWVSLGGGRYFHVFDRKISFLSTRTNVRKSPRGDGSRFKGFHPL